ncbi:PREDICTED: coiled-coil domain-containing protein 137 [Papilio polytes]|uniref:coiled-coil domain-containing protein 137 n=1 Tax=Papilio polytes TaxID=76194 RepID=UPI000676A51D|nr:PREDICTED: coiled-coil domain-containing protein 137 [Papilio polytes]
MGRKIPAKKHRGVKDPLIQQAKRIQELKGKINAPPKDPDDQPVPKSLTQLFAFENQIKEKGSNPKKKKKQYSNVRDNIKSQNDNPVAKLLKLPGETGRSFTMRINSAIKAIHSPTLQDHYPLDIEAEDSKGEQMALQRARRKRKQNKLMANTSEEPPAKLSRAQKLALKKKAKKEKALERGAGAGGGGGGEVRREHVEFGEVVHAPPALAVRPRRAAAGRDDRRPGRKELLLSAMLRAGAGAGAEAERRERARLEAVAAYRALRARAAPS